MILQREQMQEQLNQLMRQIAGQKGAIDACEFLLKEPAPTAPPMPDTPEGADADGN
jgi:hypothetical protein